MHGAAGPAFARRVRADAERVAALKAGEGKRIVRGEILKSPTRSPGLCERCGKARKIPLRNFKNSLLSGEKLV